MSAGETQTRFKEHCDSNGEEDNSPANLWNMNNLRFSDF